MEMTREEARREIRGRWREIITEYTDKAKEKANGRTSYICPFCGHGTNGDGLTHNPHSKDGNNLKCFGCGWSGDIMDLIMQTTGADYNTALSTAGASIGISIASGRDGMSAGPRSRATAAQDFQEAPGKRQEAAPFPKGKETPTEPQKTPQGAGSEAQGPDFMGYYEECSVRLNKDGAYQEDPRAIDYLLSRGISEETSTRFCIGYDPAAPDPTGRKRPGIIIPVTKGHYITRFVDQDTGRGRVRDTTITKDTEKGIFNHKAVTKAGESPIFITEGVFDALAVMEAGGEAVALNSTSGADTFLKILDGRPQEAAHPFIIALDNDQAGQATAGKLEAELRARGLDYSRANICGDHKDPNEALKANREEFSAAVGKAIEAARADELDQFLERVQTTAYRPQETGLHFFDDLLGGGVVRQTVILILAAPGSGKTTLCQQIAEEMALRGKPVIFLNLEMSQDQMIAKAISARASRTGTHDYTANDILQGYRWTPEDRAFIIQMVQEYREKVFSRMKYNPAGLDGDIDHIHAYLEAQGAAAVSEGREAPAVVLDYLHLVSTSKGLDVAELIKQTMAEIKQYAIKYNTFGIVISASNRESNKRGRITLDSGRDSSNIEYGCDAQISLNFWDFDQSNLSKLNPSNPEDLSKLQREPYRRMILRVLKARFYEPGRYSRVYFHAATSQFFGEDDFIPVREEEAGPRPFDTFWVAGDPDLEILEDIPEEFQDPDTITETVIDGTSDKAKTRKVKKTGRKKAAQGALII